MTTTTGSPRLRPNVRSRAKPVTDAELARLRELHGAGLSCRQIAKEMSRTR
jgi:hypothetical protein